MTEREYSIFEHCILASGLLSAQQLDEAYAEVCRLHPEEVGRDTASDDKAIGDQLVKAGLLNAWQIKQLHNGRTKFSLGRYRIIDSIGQGGMGHVFKAVDTKFGSVVAVKVLPRYKSTPEAVFSFAREVHTAASLQHPRLVTALDAGQDGNVHYLVTEYVPGLDLRKWVRRDGALSMSAAAVIISQVAEGLQYAHDQGMVHRDVKPGNVLVTPEGEAKLSDLGLAEPLAAERKSDPRYGKIVGTADYLAPDQVLNPGCPAPAWDIYSLGCTLYYAVTSKVPFPGGTTADKVRAHCELRPLDPRRLNAQLSDEFADLMADMMAKDPLQRIASAREVIQRLAPFIVGQAETPGLSSQTPLEPARPLVPPIVLPTPANSARPPGMDTTRSGARPVVMPLRRQSASMDWATADTETDLSALAVGSTEDEKLNGSDGPFDPSLLDEAIGAPGQRPRSSEASLDTADWPRWFVVLGVLAGVVVLLAWLIHMAEQVWSSLI